MVLGVVQTGLMQTLTAVELVWILVIAQPVKIALLVLIQHHVQHLKEIVAIVAIVCRIIVCRIVAIVCRILTKPFDEMCIHNLIYFSVLGSKRVILRD